MVQQSNVDDIIQQIHAIDEKLAMDIGSVEQKLQEDINALYAKADHDIAVLKSAAQESKDSQIDEATRLVDDESQMLITQLKNIS